MAHHLLQQRKPIRKREARNFGNHGQRDSCASGCEYKINLPPQRGNIQGTICPDRVL
jgi:hypothetical protein